jgi:hypothetical protein
VKRATIYRREDGFFVHASSRTTDGVWILDDPCLKVEEDAGDNSVGTAIRAALDGSRSGIAHPRTWTGLLESLFRLARVKSWATFAKTAKCAEIEEEGDAITVTPAINLGVDEGFQLGHKQGLVLEATTSVEVLGANVRRALS